MKHRKCLSGYLLCIAIAHLALCHGPYPPLPPDAPHPAVQGGGGAAPTLRVALIDLEHDTRHVLVSIRDRGTHREVRGCQLGHF